MPDSIEMPPELCARLLRAGVVGRIALGTDVGPHIVPVNYAVVDDFLVFRTAPYSVLGTFGRNALVAFEVDDVDLEQQHGWSIVVRGRCQWLEDPTAIARVEATWGPRPWASGSRNLYLRLPMTEISGRRLGAGWDPLAEISVRRSVGQSAV